MEWDWRTRELNSLVAAGREAYEADKQYERRQKQQKKQSKNGSPDMEPPEHGFDFGDVDNRTVVTENGQRIPASMAQDQNVVLVEDDEDTEQNE